MAAEKLLERQARILHEKQRTISQAAKHPLLRNPQTDRPVDRSQIFRWMTDGKLSVSGKRVYLEYVRHPVGNQLVTSDEAIERFAAALNQGSDVRQARRDLERDVERAAG